MKKLTLLLFVIILTFSILFLISCGEEEQQETPLAQVTVKFVIKDEVISEDVYTEGTSVNKPDITEYGAYTITHWTVNGTSKYVFFPYKVGTTDLTFFAYTTHNISVSFYAEGVKVSADTYDNNGLVYAPEAPTKEGYTFKEWRLNDESITFPYNLSKVEEDELRFEAIYEKMYKVEFISQGDVYSSQYVVNNSSIPLPSDPVVSGYTFIYWVDDNGNKLDTSKPVNNDLTYSAIFEKDLYTIKYYIGTSAIPYKTIYSSGKVLDLEYTGSGDFFGWYTSRAYATKYDFSKKITKDISLYGKVYFDDLAIIKSKGATQRIPIDATQFESLEINNVTYSSNITLSITSSAMTAKYSFTHANGSSYKITYDMLEGNIRAIFNEAAGINITVDKYNYSVLDLSTYNTEIIHINEQLNPKLETISLVVAQTAYEYVHNLYTSLHSGVVHGADLDPDIDYDVSITSPAKGKINISTNEVFYSLKVYDELSNCILYVTNDNKATISNLDMGTYRMVFAFDNNYSTYVLRQFVYASIDVL